MKAQVHIYTGDGKGKTTAALGLALRACGAGLRVYLGQFLKKGSFSELKALRAGFPAITVEQYGTGSFTRDPPSSADRKAAARGLAKLKTAVMSGKYGLAIADEANCAVSAGLIPIDALLDLVDARPDNVELVLTGRNAHPSLIRKADLVTRMKTVKHYFAKGIRARRGIEW